MNRMFSAKAWTLIATTGMLLGPALDLAAQTNANSAVTKGSSSQKTLKSAVERELEKRYRRDGKTPPKMTSSAALAQLKSAKEAEKKEQQASAVKNAAAARSGKRPQSLIQRLLGAVKASSRNAASTPTKTIVKKQSSTPRIQKTVSGAASSSKPTTIVKRPAIKKTEAKQANTKKSATKSKDDKRPRLLQFGMINRARSLSKSDSKPPTTAKKPVSRSRGRSYANSAARRRASRIAQNSTAPTTKRSTSAKPKSQNKIPQSQIQRTAKAAQPSAAAPDSTRQSEIEKRLSELYKRDGREMPPMKLSQLPGTQNAAAVPPRDLQKNAQKAGSRKSPATASAPRKSPFSFLKRLLPGRRNSARRPAQRIASQSRPKASAGKSNRTPQSSPPKVFTPPTAKKLAAAKKPQPPVVKPAVQAAAEVAKKQPKDTVDGAFTEVSEAEADKANPFSGLTLDGAKPKKLPVDGDQKIAKAPAKLKQPSKPKQAIKKLPDFGKPKADVKIAAKKSETKKDAKPTIPPKQNPFVAQTDKVTPKAAKKDDKTAQKKGKHADKYLKIAQRSDKKGLKGFCIVALRDRRELVDSNAQFKFDYNGTTYHFSSSKDQQSFAKDPAGYAPIAGGNDVTLLARTNVEIDGTLDHAVWFKGRLYLFSSKETLGVFVANPSDYVLFE